jgi:hypothetical protein
MEPNSVLKGYVLNNLALASWWHKMEICKKNGFFLFYVFFLNTDF